MDLISDDSRFLNNAKKISRQADKVLLRHHQLIELDLCSNINREGLSYFRNSFAAGNSRSALERLEFGEFEPTNTLLKLGDFFIYTTPSLIHKFLLLEKESLSKVIREERALRKKEVQEFLTLYPDISDLAIEDIKFLVEDIEKDKETPENINDFNRFIFTPNIDFSSLHNRNGSEIQRINFNLLD
ncbi:hypothetical protein ACR3K2_14000 [Cryptosporidium serpentis]